MRIVTWNCCRGTFEKNASLLAPLAADVVVMQECAKPAIETTHCLWFGDNARQGMAVVTRRGYKVRRIDSLPAAPRYVIPVEIVGPRNFVLIAVWSKGEQEHPYVEAVVRGVELYRDLIAGHATVLAGDLNSNPLWDANHRSDRNHSALVNSLAELGLVSSYHQFHGEAHGEETRPTYYFQWKKHRPFHIDYCFIPRAWVPFLKSVEVGTYSEWHASSDHTPIVVDLWRGRNPTARGR